MYKSMSIHVYIIIIIIYMHIGIWKAIDIYLYISFLQDLELNKCECEIVDWMDTYGSSPEMTLITAITAITATTHNMPIRIPKMSPKVKPSARRENGNKHKVPSCHQNANTQP